MRRQCTLQGGKRFVRQESMCVGVQPSTKRKKDPPTKGTRSSDFRVKRRYLVEFTVEVIGRKEVRVSTQIEASNWTIRCVQPKWVRSPRGGCDRTQHQQG